MEPVLFPSRRSRCGPRVLNVRPLRTCTRSAKAARREYAAINRDNALPLSRPAESGVQFRCRRSLSDTLFSTQRGVPPVPCLLPRKLLLIRPPHRIAPRFARWPYRPVSQKPVSWRFPMLGMPAMQAGLSNGSTSGAPGPCTIWSVWMTAGGWCDRG